MTFHSPAFLLLLLLVPLVWMDWWVRDRRAMIRFSTLDRMKRHGATLATRSRILLPLLRTGGLAALVVAVARPQRGDEKTRIIAQGIAIEMIVDTSSSMEALDFAVNGEEKNRLEAVKHVFREFVTGGQSLPGRENDLIGMVAFARYADSKCPLTLDHDNLLKVLAKTQIVTRRGEDRTAIGDAIALGVERLQNIKRRSRKSGQSEPIKGRVIILLTDGRNNAGQITPVKAAEVAAAFGIKIYTIGTGTKGVAKIPAGRDLFGRPRFVHARIRIDEETLTKVAQLTGGKYFRATDTDSLRQIYGEIDALEKTDVEEVRYLQVAEKAPPLMALALALLGVDVLLVSTRFRKIP